MSAKPDSMQRLFDQIDAGAMSVQELPNALRQAGGPYMAIVAAVREMAAGGGGGAAWGDITGTLSAQTDLQAALDAKAGLGANTFTALQTITQASANASILASTGYSLTGSNATSMVDLAGTWNTSGSPTALKLNVTDSASGAASLLADLQASGVSQFSVSKAGNGRFFGTVQLAAGSSQATFSTSGNALIVSTNAGQAIALQNAATIFGQWNGVPQIISGPSAGGGNTNRAADVLRLKSGTNTGSGAGGALELWASQDGGSSGTSENAQVKIAEAGADGKFKIASGKGFQVGNAATTGLVAGALSALTDSSIVIYDSTGQAYRVPCVI